MSAVICPNASRRPQLISRIFIGVILSALAALSGACSGDVRHLRCGESTGVEEVTSLLMAHKRATEEEIIKAMASCPDDRVLARLLYSAYARQGNCDMALQTHDKYSGDEGDPMFPPSDREDIFLCFYGNGLYERAVQFYENRVGHSESIPSIMAREAYAQSLFGAGDEVSAIRVLQGVEQRGHPGPLDKAESASYESAILSLAQILFANGDSRAAASAAQRFLSFRPDDAGGHEVLLAAVVKSGGIAGIDMSALYCDARRIQLEDLAGDPDSVRSELAVLKDLLLARGDSIVCQSAGER